MILKINTRILNGFKKEKSVEQLLGLEKFVRCDLIRAVKRKCIIFYTNHQQTSKQIIHGHDMEHKAKKKLGEIIKFNVMSSGLVIDPDIPYFAASPGNLIFS